MFELNSDRDLERALRELSPGPTAFDRDRFMFRAGQISGPRRQAFWPAATGVLAFAVVILAVLLVGRWQLRPQVRVIQSPPPAPAPALPPQNDQPPSRPQPAPPESAPVSTTDDIPDIAYLRLQDQLTRWGLDALPTPPPETGPEVKLPPIKIDRGTATKTLGALPRFFQ